MPLFELDQVQFPELYRGLSPLGREVTLAITGEVPAATGLEVGAGPITAPAPAERGEGPPSAAPGPAGRTPTLLRQAGTALRGIDFLRRALAVGAPLTHARSPEIEPAFQAVRAGEFVPQWQDLLAQGWTPAQIRAAESVLGPVAAGERLTPSEIASLREFLAGGGPVTLPAEITQLFGTPLDRLLSTAAAPEAAALLESAGVAAPAAPGAAAGLTGALLGLPGTVISMLPGIQERIVHALGPAGGTALMLASSVLAPFTFGLSAFIPAIAAAAAGRGQYVRHRKQAAEQLGLVLPWLAEALPLARGPEDLQFLASFVNPWVRGFRLTPTGLEVAYRELERGVQPFQEYWRTVVPAMEQIWARPELAQAYFEGQPTVQDVLRQRVLEDIGALRVHVRPEWARVWESTLGVPAAELMQRYAAAIQAWEEAQQQAERERLEAQRRAAAEWYSI